MRALTGNETMKEIRGIIASNPDLLKGIKTTGKGRTKKIIVKEINKRLISKNKTNSKTKTRKTKSKSQSKAKKTKTAKNT